MDRERAMTPATKRDLSQRITDYLSGGGLFNPELANHDAVRDLLIDCRAALSAEAPEGEGAGREAGAICGTGDPRMPGCGHARSGHTRQVSMIPRWGWSTIGCDLCPCTAFLSPPDPAPAVSPPGQSGEGPDCLCRGCGEVAATRWVYTPSGVGYAMCPDCTLTLPAPQVEGGAHLSWRE